MGVVYSNNSALQGYFNYLELIEFEWKEIAFA